jgi:hypothetical protein
VCAKSTLDAGTSARRQASGHTGWISSSENILRLIPGEFISAAGRTLPDAANAKDEPHEVTIDVAGRFTARITFRRFHYKRGKWSQWFWTAESAVKV